MNPDDTLAMIRRLNEAYAVTHKFPIERQFSDRELESYIEELKTAEADIQNIQDRSDK